MSSSRRLPRGWRSMVSRTTANGHASYSVRQERSRSRSPLQGLACSHILIKHKDCQNPVDGNDKPIYRTKDEAKKLAAEILEKIKRDLITFADAAEGYSECSSARQQGDIQSMLQRGRMQQSFEEAAHALEPGQVSGIVESNSGLHIIMRRE